MLELLQTNPISFVIIIVGLLFALTFHEAAHAFAAHWLGDSTAKMEGRLTLNPLAHLDLLGTLALIFFKFGWGKPVPVNPNNFRNPALGNFMVALAGPFTNLLLAIILAGIARLIPVDTMAFAILESIVFINILLAFFNLLPIPPLDGSKILGLFMNQQSYYELERFGPFILIGFIFVMMTSRLPFLTYFVDWISKVTSFLTGS